jgi:hypothetical protein
MEDEIAKNLGLQPINDAIEGEIVKTVKEAPSESQNDYKYARDNFYNVIEKGTDALEQMLDVAKASEHPRAYEVVSTLMKTLVDANKDLVAMSEKRSKEEDPEEDKKVTNNNLFVGSTAELQKILKDMKNE